MHTLLELISRYGVLQRISRHLHGTDLLRLAVTCKEANDYISGNDTRLDSLLCAGSGCDGNGLSLWLQRNQSKHLSSDKPKREERLAWPETDVCDESTKKERCDGCGVPVCKVRRGDAKQ